MLIKRTLFAIFIAKVIFLFQHSKLFNIFCTMRGNRTHAEYHTWLFN